MSVHLVLGLVFLVSLFVAPSIAIYAYLVSRPNRAAHREGDLLAAVVLVAATVVLGLLALARLGAISLVSVWLIAAGALVGSVFVLRRQAVESAPLSTISQMRTGLLFAGGVVIIAAPALWTIFGRLDSLNRISAWFYWQQIQQFISVGGFSGSSFEWGVVTAAFEHHLAFTALGAATAEASGAASSLAGAQAIRIVAGLAMPGSAYLAVRSWRGGRWAAVGAALLVAAISVTATKPIGFVPEGLGHILAMLTVGLVYPALIERSRAAQAALLVGMVATTQVHGIAATFLYLVVAAALLAFVALPDTGRSSRVRLVFALGALSIIGALLVGQTLGARASDAAILSDAAELDADGSDPTWEFVLWANTRGRLSEAELATTPPDNGELLRNSFTRVFIRADGWWIEAGFFLALAAAGVYGAARHGNRSLFPLLTALLAVLFVVIAGAALSLPYDTYVPRRTGLQRLVQLWPISAAVLGPLLVDRLRKKEPLTALLTAAVLLWLVAAGGVTSLNRNHATREQVRELAALPVPDGALILTNGWTQGAIAGMTSGGIGLLDGQAPYLNPELLPLSLEMLADIREFFIRPRGNSDIPGKYGADFVLVAQRSNAFGGARVYSASDDRLDLTRTLQALYRSDNYTLYSVTD